MDFQENVPREASTCLTLHNARVVKVAPYRNCEYHPEERGQEDSNPVIGVDARFITETSLKILYLRLPIKTTINIASGRPLGQFL